MTTYSINSAAKADFMKLVEHAVRDGEVALTRDGQVIAKLVAVAPTKTDEQPVRRQRVFGRLKGKLVVPPDFDEPLEEMRPYMEGPKR